jgi:hypothetical protein
VDGKDRLRTCHAGNMPVSRPYLQKNRPGASPRGCVHDPSSDQSSSKNAAAISVQFTSERAAFRRSAYRLAWSAMGFSSSTCSRSNSGSDHYFGGFFKDF